jgi:uncharacterized membrane protein YeaQ/YmgE (transglycosylase-associated protein family)
MWLSVWIILGLIVGLEASRIVGSTERGIAIDLAFGIGGAVTAGWFFTDYGMAGFAGFSAFGVLAAAVGAALLLATYHNLGAGIGAAYPDDRSGPGSGPGGSGYGLRPGTGHAHHPLDRGAVRSSFWDGGDTQ